ncbi:MAG: EAL domain-containing protein [Dehalococcoidia bacterium]|nr:EAL domain-containing protein [Dehalococcoidia bacterium]
MGDGLRVSLQQLPHSGNPRRAPVIFRPRGAAPAPDPQVDDLIGAAARGELFVQYQPIVSLPGRNLHSFEALVRWQYHRRGLISPVDFISQAAASGEIIAIGQFV